MGWQDPEPVAILFEGAREGIDVSPERNALLTGGGDRAVVDVGEVHDVEDLVAAGLEPPAQEVLEQEGAKVSDDTASGVMGAYYAENIANNFDTKLTLLIEQGIEIEKDGRVKVELTQNNNQTYDIEITGNAVL